MLSDRPDLIPDRPARRDGIRPDASFPDAMDRADGGSRLPGNPQDGGLIPKVVPPLPRESSFARALPWTAALAWLRAGWRDLATNPIPNLLYGLGTFAASLLVLWFLVKRDLSYLIVPALAGLLVLGPLAAAGLCQKSRRQEEGRPARLRAMLLVRPCSGTAVLVTGVLTPSL